MLQLIEHPGKIIPAELRDLLRKYAADAEKLGELHPFQLEIIFGQNWFHLFVPKEYGGLELDLPKALRIEESLAWIDGSLGWTVTLCSGANWFVGFLKPGIAREIFSKRKVCLAGSGRATGLAKLTSHGYEVNGYWKYATGAPHATIFTANCRIEEKGELLKDENGDPIVRTFWFKSNEVVVNKDWNAIGMIATASHSFEVKDLIVGRERTFVIDSDHRLNNHPVYNYPFLQFAETTLAVNNSGMAVCFLDLCESIFAGRTNDKSVSNNISSERLAVAKERLNKAREVFYSVVEMSWDSLIENRTIHNDLLNKISEVSRALAKIARLVVDDLYPYCGMVAASPATDINRVWRNIHTASQHSLLL